MWGSGAPLRQFCYAPDLALLLLWVTFVDGTKCNRWSEELLQGGEPLALVPAEEHSIADLARAIASQFSHREVIFDATKADGQSRKCMGN